LPAYLLICLGLCPGLLYDLFGKKQLKFMSTCTYRKVVKNFRDRVCLIPVMWWHKKSDELHTPLPITIQLCPTTTPQHSNHPTSSPSLKMSEVHEITSIDQFNTLVTDASADTLVALNFHAPWAAPCAQMNQLRPHHHSAPIP